MHSINQGLARKYYTLSYKALKRKKPRLSGASILRNLKLISRMVCRLKQSLRQLKHCSLFETDRCCSEELIDCS